MSNIRVPHYAEEAKARLKRVKLAQIVTNMVSNPDQPLNLDECHLWVLKNQTGVSILVDYPKVGGRGQVRVYVKNNKLGSMTLSRSHQKVIAECLDMR